MLESVEHIRSIPRKQWRGELGYLAAISPTVHRLALETIERQATAFADAILDSTEVAPEIARLEGIAAQEIGSTTSFKNVFPIITSSPDLISAGLPGESRG